MKGFVRLHLSSSLSPAATSRPQPHYLGTRPAERKHQASSNKPIISALNRLCAEPAGATSSPHAVLRHSAEEGHIMGMSATRPITTIEELLALPDDGMRHELLDGVHVVTPSPIKVHQRVLRNVFYALDRAVGPDASIEILWSPADIHLSPTTLVQPDVFIVTKPGSPSDDTWEHTPVPLLAVEVLSPSTASRDRGAKRRLYLDAGVEEYWIVDIDGRVIERWHSGDARPEIVEESLEWSLSAGVSGVIEVASLFE